MSEVLNLELMTFGGQIFARLMNFSMFAGHPTLAGVEFVFEFSIVGTEFATKTELVLERFQIDLSVFVENQKELYIGQFREALSESYGVTNYEKRFQRRLEITQNAYWRLVDSTHHNDLDLRFNVAALGTGKTVSGEETIFLQGDKRVSVAHSDWLAILSRGQFDRFEIITIRSQVAPTGKGKEIFDSAITKLKEAEACFDRGDWNGVGARCRSAWLVFKTSVHKKDQGRAIELLLASVTGDPRRREFGEAILKGCNDILNKATHLEGDTSTNTLPVDLQREDALLCLHWTAAILSYLASIRHSE